MKVLVDMNLSPQWVGTLASTGIDAVHWSTVGARAAPDSAIMAHARANGYVVLTHDLDFGAILAATHGEKPSMIQIRADDIRPDSIDRQVILALRQVETELVAGVLLTIEPARTRLRVLPLRQKLGQ